VNDRPNKIRVDNIYKKKKLIDFYKKIKREKKKRKILKNVL